jgi:hypothetical protein
MVHPGLSVITGQPLESHSKNSSRKALFSCDWIFQEKELCFRFRSWRVSAGGRAPMNYDSFYPTFYAATQARDGLGQRLRQDPAAMPCM